MLKSITFAKIDTIAIIVFSIYALLKGEITVFFMLYLFWWQTFIHVFVNSLKVLLLKKNVALRPKLRRYFGENMFLLFIYFVFIVILFGVIMNFDNSSLLQTNMIVLFFHNWSFNFNLIVFLITAVFFDKYYKDDVRNFTNAFFPRNIVLHLSIIIGALLHFFVVIKYPSLFKGETLWGSLLVTTPFLIIKTFFDVYLNPNKGKEE